MLTQFSNRSPDGAKFNTFRLSESNIPSLITPTLQDRSKFTYRDPSSIETEMFSNIYHIEKAESSLINTKSNDFNPFIDLHYKDSNRDCMIRNVLHTIYPTFRIFEAPIIADPIRPYLCTNPNYIVFNECGPNYKEHKSRSNERDNFCEVGIVIVNDPYFTRCEELTFYQMIRIALAFGIANPDFVIYCEYIGGNAKTTYIKDSTVCPLGITYAQLWNDVLPFINRYYDEVITKYIEKNDVIYDMRNLISLHSVTNALLDNRSVKKQLLIVSQNLS